VCSGGTRCREAHNGESDQMPYFQSDVSGAAAQSDCSELQRVNYAAGRLPNSNSRATSDRDKSRDVRKKKAGAATAEKNVEREVSATLSSRRSRKKHCQGGKRDTRKQRCSCGCGGSASREITKKTAHQQQRESTGHHGAKLTAMQAIMRVRERVQISFSGCENIQSHTKVRYN